MQLERDLSWKKFMDSNSTSASTVSPLATLPSTSSADYSTPTGADHRISLLGLDAISIAINAVCFICGVCILVDRKHAFLLLMIFGPFVPGLLTSSAVGGLTLDGGLVKSTILSVVSGLGICFTMWLSFYFLPCVAASTFLSFLSISVCLLLVSAMSLGSGLLALVVPTFGSILAVLVVYSLAKVPVLRSKDFQWTDSTGVRGLHLLITTLACSYGIVTSLMYFTDSRRISLMSLCHAMFEATVTENGNEGAIGLGVWLGTWIGVIITRTSTFDFCARWIWSKIKKPKDPESLSLVANADNKLDATEFGLKQEDDMSLRSLTTVSFPPDARISLQNS